MPPPSTNLEIKARCRDPRATRAAAQRVATRRVGIDRQVDTYFRTRSGRLKLREIFLYENVRIHLDRVEGLGEFLEFEAVYDGRAVTEAAEQKKLDFLMKELGVGEGDLLAASYEGLVREGEATPPRTRPSSAR